MVGDARQVADHGDQLISQLAVQLAENKLTATSTAAAPDEMEHGGDAGRMPELPPEPQTATA